MGSVAVPVPSAGNPAGMATGNPNYDTETTRLNQALIPGGNPNGSSLGNFGPSIFNPATNAKTNAVTGQPMSTGTPAPNVGLAPYVAPIGTPNTSAPNGTTFGYPNGSAPATAGGAPATGVSPGNFPYNGIGTAGGKAANGVPSALGLPVPGGGALSKQWGSMGASINAFIQSGMGFNPQVAGMIARDITPYFEENMGNLLEMFGAGGSRYSSSAGLAAGQMTASFTGQQEQIFAQMYQHAVDAYMQILTGGRYKEGGGGGIMSMISGGMGIAGAAGGALEAAGVGAGGGALGAVIGGLAAL